MGKQTDLVVQAQGETGGANKDVAICWRCGKEGLFRLGSEHVGLRPWRNVLRYAQVRSREEGVKGAVGKNKAVRTITSNELSWIDCLLRILVVAS